MKAKHAILLFFTGICLVFIGAFLKILHYDGAEEFLIAGISLKAVGALLFLYKLFTHRKGNEFMNS